MRTGTGCFSVPQPSQAHPTPALRRMCHELTSTIACQLRGGLSWHHPLFLEAFPKHLNLQGAHSFLFCTVLASSAGFPSFSLHVSIRISFTLEPFPATRHFLRAGSMSDSFLRPQPSLTFTMVCPSLCFEMDPTGQFSVSKPCLASVSPSVRWGGNAPRPPLWGCSEDAVRCG